MNRIFSIALIFILFPSFHLIAQDSTQVWKFGGNSLISISQVSLTNWAAGGENSLSSVGELNLFANYKKDKISFDNKLSLAYGILKQGEKPVIKSDDRIDLSSKFGRQASKVWYYAALLNFKTQFTDGFNYPNDSVRISTFLAPAYLGFSVGMDYKPNDKISTYFSPVSGKTTIVNDEILSNAGAFGVETGNKVRWELGGYFKLASKHKIMENVNFENTLELFSNYINNPQNIDVNYVGLINMKVNKFLSANLSANLIYDDDIKILVDENTGKTGPRTQFKEVFGLGISFKF
jgi:hypothetical protein